MLALTVSKILMFKNVDFEKIGQGHRVQLSQCRYSVTNVNIYKVIFYIFEFLHIMDLCE